MNIVDITLQNLPTKSIPDMHLIVVLTQDEHIGKYRAYIGGVDMPPFMGKDSEALWDAVKDENASYVAAHGNKLSWERASIYFPNIPKEQYNG